MNVSYRDRYKSLLSNLNAGIVVHGPDTKIIEYNQKAAELLGLPHEELTGKDASAPEWVFTDEKGDLLSQDSYPVNKILQTRKPFIDSVLGIKHLDKDKIVWVRVNGAIVTSEDGNGTEIMISFIDITDERVASERIREQEEAYQRLFQTMSQGVIYQDSEGTIIAANPSAEKILNLSVDKMKGMNSEDSRWKMINEDGVMIDSKEHPAMIALRTGKKTGPLTRGVYVPERDTYVWLKISAIPLYDGNDSIVSCVYATFEDITKQREKDAEIKKLSKAIEQSPVSVVITDTNGNIEYVNPKFERLTGYSLSEVLGKNPRILNSGEQNGDIYKNLWQTITSGGTWRGEFKNKKKNGEFYWESVNISPIKNDLGTVTHYLAVKEDITELKKQEIKLIESEKRFREIFETLPLISVQGYNEKREVIYWNKASEYIYGYTKKEALGRKLEDLIIPDVMRETVIQHIGNWICHDMPIPSEELVLRHADGSPVPVFSNHVMVSNAEGKKEIYCIDIDLRELKEKEEKLRQTEELYRSIIEMSDIGAWEYDVEEDILWLSPDNFTMLGHEWNETELNGVNGFELWKKNLHPEDRDNAVKKFRSFLAGDLMGIYEDQFRLLHKNGSFLWVLTRGRCLKNSDGTPSNIVTGIQIDITESKRAEEQIKESDLYHRSLLRTIPDLIFVLDKDGNFLDYKTDSHQVYVDHEEFLGKNVADIFHQEIAESHKKATEQAFRENKPVEFQYSLTENGSPRFFSSKIAVFGKDKVITVVRDITDRVKNINKLERLLKVEEQQNKKLTNFTHIVSHNLRTHTANMKGLLSLVEIENPELGRDQYMKMIADSVNYLSETIDDLNQVLKINHKSENNLQKVNLTRHLKKAINDVATLAKKARFNIQNDVPKHAEMYAMPAYIDSIILNMLTNAIKYRSEDRDSFVRISYKHDDSFTELSFEDNGVGIDLELYGSKIFGMYKTFHENNDSVGLGLFITKSQIEAMGGSINVLSCVNEGTTFKIRLPYGKN